MKKGKSTVKSQRNKPLDISEHPVNVRGAKVAPEIITEQQEIQQVSVDEQLKQQRLKEHAEKVLKPYQFVPGQSGNPDGRPRDIIKEIGQRIASKRIGKALNPKERKLAEDLDMKPDDISLLENILLQLATSKNPAKIELFLDRAFGKVPNININAELNQNIVERFKAKLTDAELERIASGEDAMQILFDKLPDVEDDNVIDVTSENG